VALLLEAMDRLGEQAPSVAQAQVLVYFFLEARDSAAHQIEEVLKYPLLRVLVRLALQR
jgi:hypothetical protein